MVRKGILAQSAVGALLGILCSAGMAHAHGGMAGPDELGPPVGISVGIGLACYYLITLWPARERGGAGRRSVGETMPTARAPKTASDEARRARREA